MQSTQGKEKMLDLGGIPTRDPRTLVTEALPTELGGQVGACLVEGNRPFYSYLASDWK